MPEGPPSGDFSLTEQIPSLEGQSARERFVTLHREIRKRICFLDYAPGTRLSEEALAEEFGISRTPLRRALARLEDEGLVQSVHGVGTIVTDVNLDELTQVYLLRMELTELIAKLSPVPPDAALVQEFRAIREQSDTLEASQSPREFTRINEDFFQAMLKLTGNDTLREICERLYYRTSRIWLKSVFASRIDLAKEIRIFRREVDEIVSAIELGDVTAVGYLSRAHISMSFARFRQE